MQNLQEVSQNPQIPPPVSENRGQAALFEIVEKLPPNSYLTFYEKTWEDYENLLEAVGEASGLRISFDDGDLHIMTLSTEHESYARLVQMFIGILSLQYNIEIESFGSATIKQSPTSKGTEPDACFYVQSVEKLGNSIKLDFSVDPPPDIAVEIDIHHESLYKFPIYAKLGVSEIWRYDSKKFEIHKLEKGKYKKIERSESLPVLNAKILGELLNRSREERQTQILKDFEKWLKEQK